MVPTYREGPLAASAVRTLLECCNVVLVFEGPITGAPDEGFPTELDEFKKNQRVLIKHGSWASEVAKRNAMLEFTRRYKPPVWGVYLDADEILIDAQWIRDYLWACEVNHAGEMPIAAIPLLIQEVDSSVGRIHRILRLDLLEAHILSMSQMKFFGWDTVVTFPVVPLWRPGQDIQVTEEISARPPMQGEPHIHHRSYYRPPKRGEYRLHKLEGEDFQALERDALEKLGIKVDRPGEIPILQDPGFIVAKEQGAKLPPGAEDPYGLLEK